MTALDDLIRQDYVTPRARPGAARHRKAGRPAIGPRHATRANLYAGIRTGIRDGWRAALAGDAPPTAPGTAGQLQQRFGRAS